MSKKISPLGDFCRLPGFGPVFLSARNVVVYQAYRQIAPEILNPLP